MSNQVDGKWMDEWGCCRVCGGEIPHGHTNGCDVFKMEQCIAVAKEAVQKNHEWHELHDDYDGYKESDLLELNLKALALIEKVK